MAITFNAWADFHTVYTWDSIDGLSANLTSSTAFDLFRDDAQVGDYVIFAHKIDSACPYRNVQFDIGTAIVADSYTLVWEYWKENVGWSPLTVTDDTTSFSVTGQNTVEFDPPEDWEYSYTTGVYYWYVGVRVRLSAVSNISEGGAIQNQKVQRGNNRVWADDSESVEEIYQAGQDNSWVGQDGTDIIQKIGSKSYVFYSHLWMGNNGVDEYSITENDVSLEFKRRATFYFDNTDNTWNRCRFYEVLSSYQNHHGRGYFVQSFDTGNVFNDCLFDFDVKDTQVESQFYFYGTTTLERCIFYMDAAGRIVIYGTGTINNVTANGTSLAFSYGAKTIDNFVFKGSQFGVDQTGATWITVDNPTFEGITQMMCYNARMYLRNPEFEDATYTKYLGLNNDQYKIQYSVDINVRDEDGIAIDGATVILTDTNGDETFSETTDASGDTTQQYVTTEWVIKEAGVTNTYTYNDFALKVSKVGYRTVGVKNMTIDKAMHVPVVIRKTRIMPVRQERTTPRDYGF